MIGGKLQQNYILLAYATSNTSDDFAFTSQEYDVLVTNKSLIVFHKKTMDTQVIVRSHDPVFGQEYTFGIACHTECGYGERINLTIYYPGKFLFSGG